MLDISVRLGQAVVNAAISDDDTLWSSGSFWVALLPSPVTQFVVAIQ